MKRIIWNFQNRILTINYTKVLQVGSVEGDLVQLITSFSKTIYIYT